MHRQEGRIEDAPAVVLDTNLFIAAYWNKGSASAEITEACREGRARLYFTQQIRRELFHILGNIKAHERYRQEVNDALDRGTEIAAPGELHVVAEDPDDDKFLECARIANADYLVTNDDHLLRIGEFERTKIVKPSEFRRILHEL